MVQFENWQSFIENLTAVSVEDHHLAQNIIIDNIDKVDNTYGKHSSQSAVMRYYQGIVAMLLKDYNAAENSFLEAMNILENSKDFDVKFYSDITKHLSLAYEALGQS